MKACRHPLLLVRAYCSVLYSMAHGAFFGVNCILVFIGPQPMEVIEISSDMARSIALGAGSWSSG